MTIIDTPAPLSTRTFGRGPGVVLAHGAGGSIDGNFTPVFDRLSAGHTVVATDYPGAGGSPREADPLQLDDLADRLVATALDQNLDEFAMVGYSLGTAVSVRAAVRHPQHVTALVLTAGIAFPDATLNLALDVWSRLLDGDQDLLARFLLLVSSGVGRVNDLNEEEIEEVLHLISQTVPPGTAEHIDLVRRVDTRADLANIAVPTLVIATAADALVLPTHSLGLAEAIPNAKLIEIDAGHNIAGEQGEAWATAILDFLNSL